MSPRPHSRPAGALVLATLLAVPVAGCSQTPSTVAPLTVPSGASTTPPVLTDPGPRAVQTDGDDVAVQAAVQAVHAYLREQASAINAGSAEPADVPGLTATLTPAASTWALPLLAANLGDVMPGPYPMGVLGSTVEAEGQVRLALCLQVRGWQVDRSTGATRNQPQFATASALVVTDGEGWLVDDVATDGGSCAATDVEEERF